MDISTTNRVFAVALTALLPACGWVDSTGRTKNTAPEIQFDATVVVLEERSSLKIPVLDDTQVMVSFTAQAADGSSLASCGTWLPMQQTEQSLSAACVDSERCTVQFEADASNPNTYQLTAPEVLKPVALQYLITAEDNDGEQDQHRFDLCIRPVDDAPTTQIDTYVVPYQQTLTLPGVSFDAKCRVAEGNGVLDNDSDDLYSPTDQAASCISAELSSSPLAHRGGFQLQRNGGFKYTSDGTLPPGSEDSFSYTAYDGSLHSEQTRVTLIISGDNHPPVANDNTHFESNSAAALQLTPGQLATDPEGFELSIVSLQAPTRGSAALRDGKLYYTAPPGYHGEAQLSALLSDPAGATTHVTVYFDVLAVNQKPELGALPDTEHSGNSEAVIVIFQVSDNETTAADLSIAVRSSAQSVATLVQINEPDHTGRGSFALTALSNGETTITLEITDAAANGQPANTVSRAFSLRVSDIRDSDNNHRPRARNDRYTLRSLEEKTFDVSLNDTDADGDSLSYRLSNRGDLGNSVSLSTRGELTVEAPFLFGDNIYWVRYQADDGYGGIDEATVRLTVRSFFSREP